MPAYFDTGTLVPLYVKEVFSLPIKRFMDGRKEFIPIHLFHCLEMENALRLKVFRGEIDGDRCSAVLARVQVDIGEGSVVLQPVDWIAALEEARRIGARVTVRAGCRTLDLLHVAIAAQWECEVFVTADDRQLKAARSVGLRTVDVRRLPPEDVPDGSPPAVVRERHVRYGTRKQALARRGFRARKGVAR
jgi:hypothetical protein